LSSNFTREAESISINKIKTKTLIQKMANQQTLLSKGIKYLAWALPLLFIGPTVIYNAFINKQNAWHYLVLAIGIIICLSAVYLMLLGLKTIMKSLFND
jgi:hypothetical protein